MLGDVLRSTYRADPTGGGSESGDLGSEPALHDLFGALGGCTFDGGLYRVHLPAVATRATELVEEAMPTMRGRVVCFGRDWLGRQFAIDRTRLDGGVPLVLMLEPGTGEALEIPVTVGAFHDEELVEFGEEALAVTFYRNWREATGDSEPLGANECVGYRLPLFTGGTDEVGNLERTDLEVYWHFCGQLHQRTRGLAQGTPIARIDDSR